MWSSSTHEASQKASWTNLYLCNFHPRGVTKETGQNDLFLACFRTNFLKTYVLKDDDRSFLLTAPEKKSTGLRGKTVRLSAEVDPVHF